MFGLLQPNNEKVGYRLKQIKEELFADDFKNLGWENEVGDVVDEFIDDCFADFSPSILDRYIGKIVTQQIDESEKLKNLSDKKRQRLWLLSIKK